MKIKRNALCACVAFVASWLLTSCANNQGIEGLLNPPRLTQEQSEIYQALLADTGKNIKLKYPKSGEYRSAIIMRNIDDEPSEEAIVFYEKIAQATTEASLRICILDQQDGKWRSAYNSAGAGTDIDKIMFTSLAKDDVTNIVVGYTMLNQTEKAVRIYTYSNGALQDIATANDRYSVLETMDIDNDNVDELIMVTITNNETGKAAVARMLSKVDNKVQVVSDEVPMDPGTLEYVNVVKGYVDKQTPALFLDSTRSNEVVGTEVLYCEDSKLRSTTRHNPEKNADKNPDKTLRPIGVASADIDKDSIVEVPVVIPFPGYENLPQNERVNTTDWLVFDGKTFITKYVSYYSLTNGYVFMLPERWKGTVTAKISAENSNEIIFYRYDGQLENMVEIMRIRTVTNSYAEKKALKDEGYQPIITNGQIEYFIKMSLSSREPLVLTMSEVRYYFKVIG